MYCTSIMWVLNLILNHSIRLFDFWITSSLFPGIAHISNGFGITMVHTDNISASGGLKIRKKVHNNVPQILWSGLFWFHNESPWYSKGYAKSNDAGNAGWELDVNGTRCDHHIANHITFKYNESFVSFKNVHYNAHYDTNYDANHYANHGANHDDIFSRSLEQNLLSWN